MITSLIAGYRVPLLAGLALAALAVSVVAFNSIQDSGRNEERLDNLKDQLEVRSNIDAEVRNAPRDVESALELLRHRQNP